MTGQVKEEIITRFGELGVVVQGGLVSFDPVILRRNEFLNVGGIFEYYDIEGGSQAVETPRGSLAFTYCQVPVIYQMTGEKVWLEVTSPDGQRIRREGNSLDPDESSALFDRIGTISRIDVGIRKDSLL